MTWWSSSCRETEDFKVNVTKGVYFYSFTLDEMLKELSLCNVTLVELHFDFLLDSDGRFSTFLLSLFTSVLRDRTTWWSWSTAQLLELNMSKPEPITWWLIRLKDHTGVHLYFSWPFSKECTSTLLSWFSQHLLSVNINMQERFIPLFLLLMTLRACWSNWLMLYLTGSSSPKIESEWYTFLSFQLIIV